MSGFSSNGSQEISACTSPSNSCMACFRWAYPIAHHGQTTSEAILIFNVSGMVFTPKYVSTLYKFTRLLDVSLCCSADEAQTSTIIATRTIARRQWTLLMTRQQHVLQDDIGTLIRRLSAPMALGILGIMLFTLVDTWFIALLGTTELAAVSFTFPVTFAVMSLSMGFSVGMAAVLGRILGSGQQRRAARVTTDGLLLSTLLISLLALLGLFTMQP